MGSDLVASTTKAALVMWVKAGLHRSRPWFGRKGLGHGRTQSQSALGSGLVAPPLGLSRRIRLGGKSG